MLEFQRDFLKMYAETPGIFLCNLLIFPCFYCLYCRIYNNLLLCYNFIKVIPITYYLFHTYDRH